MKTKLLLFSIISAFIGIAAMSITVSGKTYETPIFYLQFSMNETGVEIRVNDIPAYYHAGDGMTSSEKPVPEYIIDGKNVLTVKTFSAGGGSEYPTTAFAEASILVREKDEPSGSGDLLAHLRVEPAAPKDDVLHKSVEDAGDGDPALITHVENKETMSERSFRVDSPYPRWAWQDGQAIQDTEENFRSLMKVYQEIHKALKNSDMEKITSLYSNAATEFAYAYGYADPLEGHRIIDTGGLVGDDKWALADIDKLRGKMHYKLNIFADGRMANIIDQDRRTPIIYLNKEVKMLNVQKFSFYKDDDGEWVMIR